MISIFLLQKEKDHTTLSGSIDDPMAIPTIFLRKLLPSCAAAVAASETISRVCLFLTFLNIQNSYMTNRAPVTSMHPPIMQTVIMAFLVQLPAELLAALPVGVE